jgi:phosphosulfolactate phosphohydrolase-like enzyme
MPEGFKYLFIYLLGVFTYHLCTLLYNNHLTIKYIKKEKDTDSVVVVSVKRWDRNAIDHFTALGYERSKKHG